MAYDTYDLCPDWWMPSAITDLLTAARTTATNVDPVGLVILGDSTFTNPSGNGASSFPYFAHALSVAYGNCPATPWARQISGATAQEAWLYKSLLGGHTNGNNLAGMGAGTFTSTGVSANTVTSTGFTVTQANSAFQLVGAWVRWNSGPNATIADSDRQITAYDEATDTITVSPDWATLPSVGNTFTLAPEPTANVPMGMAPAGSYSGALATCLLLTYDASNAVPDDIRFRHLAIGDNLAIATVTGQVIALGCPNHGGITWWAKPKASTTTDWWDAQTATGTLSDAALVTSNHVVKRLANITLPFATGKPYMQLQLGGASVSARSDWLTARFVSDVNRAGIAVSTLSEGGYTAAMVQTWRGNAFTSIAEMGVNIVLHAMGTNEATGRTAAQFYADTAANVASLNAVIPNCCHIFDVTPYRTGVTGGAATEWDQYAGALYTLAQATPRCGFINSRKMLARYGWDANGQAAYLSDGVHYTTGGARLRGDVLAGAMIASMEDAEGKAIQLAADQATVVADLTAQADQIEGEITVLDQAVTGDLTLTSVTQQALDANGFGASLATKLSQMNTGRIAFSGPMLAQGNFVFYGGDDATLSWTVTWTGTPTSAVIRIASEVGFQAGQAALLEKACQITQDGSNLTVTVTLTDTETATLPTVIGNASYNLRAQVVLTAGGAEQTIVDAKGRCRRHI